MPLSRALPFIVAAAALHAASAAAAPVQPRGSALVLRRATDGSLETRQATDAASHPGLLVEIAATPPAESDGTPSPCRVWVAVRNATTHLAYNVSLETEAIPPPRSVSRVIYDATLWPGVTSRAEPLELPEATCTGGRPLRVRARSAPWFVGRHGGFGSEPGRFSKPKSIAVTPERTLLVADMGNHRVQEVGLDGRFVAKWGAYGSDPGAFDHPSDVAWLAGDRTVLVADSSNDRIQFLTRDGRFERSFGRGARPEENLNRPRGVAVSPDGKTLHVADAGNARIASFTAEGTFLRAWGTFGEGPGQFREIQDVKVFPDGRVVTVDSANRTVDVFTATGTFLARLDGGRCPMGRFGYPMAVAPMASGLLVVADFGLDRVVALTLDGNCAGEFGRHGDTPGALQYPSDLVVLDDLLVISEVDSSTMDVFAVAGWAGLEGRAPP